MNNPAKSKLDQSSDDIHYQQIRQKFNEFIERPETTLQLHAQRYEGFERSYEIFARSAVILNGGASLALLTTESLERSPYDLNFALWFVVGCIAFLVGAFARYNGKRELLNNPVAYFPVLADSTHKLDHIKNKVRLLSSISVSSLFLSLFAFSLGCAHGFLVMNEAAVLP